jgi:signal transduction histidine kinase
MSARLLFRLTAPLVASSLLLLAVGVGAAWYVQRSQKTLTDELRANVSGMRAAEELEILVRETRTRLDHFLITGDRKYLLEAPALRQEMDFWLTEAERWSLTPQERQWTARARQGHEAFHAGLEQLADDGQPEALRRRVRGLIDDLLVREILEPTHEYLDFNEAEVEQCITDNQTFAGRLALGLLLLGTCGSGAGLVAGLGFARRFSRSLIQLSVPVRAAAGQLDEVVGPVTLAPGGDLNELEGVLHVIADRIGAVIRRLRQSERETLRAEQLAAVGQMAAGMAHELRNPLTSMKVLVQAALEGDGADGRGAEGGDAGAPGLRGRDLAVLEEEITRLDELLQSFVDFARPPRLERRTLDVRPLVEQTLGLVAGRASATGTRVRFAAPEGPVRAAVDPGQFRQVLLNLLLNALDAVRAGGDVEVDLEGRPDGGLVLRVSDTGGGLPPALGARIFAPFVTTKEAGLGLGLSVCKRIVEAHGGTVTGADRPEGGAEFVVRLPPQATGQEPATDLTGD